MHQKGGDGIANSVDPDQTAPRSSLFWVCTVCSDLSVPILRTFTVQCNAKSCSQGNVVTKTNLSTVDRPFNHLHVH